MIQNSGLRPPKKDIRDFKYADHFGSTFVTDLSKAEFDYSGNPKILDQSITDFCTAFSTASLMEVTEGTELAPEHLFAKGKQIEGNYKSFGADPKHILKALCSVGMLEKKVCPLDILKDGRDKCANWINYPTYLDDAAKIHRAKAYFKPSGQKDLFDSIRDIIQTQKVGIVAGVYWQNGWTRNAVIPKTGKYLEVNPHQIYIRPAQKVINGEVYLVCQNSYGDKVGDKGLFYFPREIINRFMFAYAVLDADPEDVKRETWNLLARIKDVLVKMWQSLGTLPIPMPPVRITPDEELPPPAPKPVKSKIERWALAIEKEEGFAPKTRSWRNNNPGNIKWSSLIQSLGASSKDPDGFAVFPSYDAGFNALCSFLRLACTDQLKAYHNARTLEQFTQVYALPPKSHPYAANVAKALGVSVKVDIKTLL